MRRRDFIKLIGSAAVAQPLAARAQQPQMPVIGILSSVPPETYEHLLPVFRQGLNETGFIEGQNVTFDYRWAEGGYDRFSELAAEMVHRKVAVILAIGGTASALAAKATTSTIPIVFVVGSDPVNIGLVASLSEPGGNVTGVTSLANFLASKQFELLHQVAPNAATIGLLLNPDNSNAEQDRKGIQAAADKFNQKLVVGNARTEGELLPTFAAFARQQVGALLVASDLSFLSRRDQLVALAARYKIPTIYDRPDFVVAGGLMSYGNSRIEIFHEVGIYAGRILKGKKPTDLPVQEATKVELNINLRTAKALGLSLPLELLGRADEVIE